MLRKSEWFVDHRPVQTRIDRSKIVLTTWEEWANRHPNAKEQWLMSIIELLLKNQDWAGAFLLIQTYISTCKQGEGNRFYNQTPFSESVHVRVIRNWFWDLVEEYGFAMPEEEIPYEEERLTTRRSIDRKVVEDYPFVGGKPKRRYSEAAEFFQQVAADRGLHTKFRTRGDAEK